MKMKTKQGKLEEAKIMYFGNVKELLARGNV
jgi:hypothetical protein